MSPGYIRWDKIRDKIVSMPPLEAALIAIILFAIPIDILSFRFGLVNPAELQGLKNYVRQTPLRDLIYYTVILNPLQEEIRYRGLGRIAVWLVPPDTFWKKTFAWIVIVVPTVYWAMFAGGHGHGIPADALVCGIGFGWLLIRTRSLEQVFILHAAYNAIDLVGALIRIRFL